MITPATTVTTAAPTAFRVHTIPEDVLNGARASGTDVSGNPIEHMIADGGEPLRCCLRDAEPAEHIILFGYEPRLPPSPYSEIGAVFAHEQTCDGPLSPATYPAAWRGRPQVLRAYDQRGWIRDPRVHDGEDPESVIAEILADPDVVQIHSRNVAWGCYMFAITRTP
jgi:hypothetical protein